MTRHTVTIKARDQATSTLRGVGMAETMTWPRDLTMRINWTRSRRPVRALVDRRCSLTHYVDTDAPARQREYPHRFLQYRALCGTWIPHHWKVAPLESKECVRCARKFIKLRELERNLTGL